MWDFDEEMELEAKAQEIAQLKQDLAERDARIENDHIIMTTLGQESKKNKKSSNGWRLNYFIALGFIVIANINNYKQMYNDFFPDKSKLAIPKQAVTSSSTPVLTPDDVAFTYIMGAENNDKDLKETLAADQQTMKDVPAYLSSYSNNISVYGDGISTVDLSNAIKQAGANSQNVKHNIVWLKLHGLAVTDDRYYEGKIVRSEVYDTSLQNVFNRENILETKNAGLYTYIKELAENTKGPAENTFVFNSCNAGGAILATKDFHSHDMGVFLSDAKHYTYGDVSFFLPKLENDSHGLNRSNTMEAILKSSWYPDHEVNLPVIAYAVKKSKVKVIDMATECRKLYQYSPEDISACMKQQGFKQNMKQIVHLRAVSKNLHNDQDVRNLGEENFTGLMLATYAHAMNHISKYQSLSTYAAKHHLVEPPPPPPEIAEYGFEPDHERRWIVKSVKKAVPKAPPVLVPVLVTSPLPPPAPKVDTPRVGPVPI